MSTNATAPTESNRLTEAGATQGEPDRLTEAGATQGEPDRLTEAGATQGEASADSGSGRTRMAELVARRPKRADARRNYDRVLVAAREAFADSGTSASLEEIARRADVGIGTLYRNFPSRQALLEAVYVDEVDQLCRSTVDLESLPPWEAFEGFARRLVSYLQTKQALAQELLDYVDRDAIVFMSCKQSLQTAGGPLLARAQAAQVVRADAALTDVIHLIGGIAKMPSSSPEQIDHILTIALDGFRYREHG